MENFELKYKSALGSATTMYACAQESDDKEMIQSLELIFPELKESDDEKTKRMLDIIAYKMSQHQPDIFTGEENEWFNAWLEKQQTTNSKTNWSKEDETIFACIIGTLIWTINNNYHCSEDIPKYMRWLENLKQRLNGTE